MSSTLIGYSTRDLPTDITVRDYLNGLKPTSRMTQKHPPQNFSKNPKKFQKSCFNPPNVCYHNIRQGKNPSHTKQSITPHRGTIRKWR